MAYEAKKTEHNGSKKGRGAFWGHKADAKKESSRRRRIGDRKIVQGELKEYLNWSHSFVNL